jgi:uncharacterized protein YegP (UPF0339 family)
VRFLQIGALLLTLAAPASAYSPEAYPGATWGEISRDASGLEGNGTMGWVRQGVRWYTFPFKIQLESYGAYHWRMRSENRRFYNVHGPAVGTKLGWWIFDAGIEQSWETFPELTGTDNKSSAGEYYIGWYDKWDWMQAFPGADWGNLIYKAMPFTTWGHLAHNLDGIQGDSIMGKVRQGFLIRRFAKSIELTTFGAYRWRFRTKNRRFFNAHGPAVGIALDFGNVDLTVDYSWLTYPELSRKTNSAQFHLGWYFDWDLKEVARKNWSVKRLRRYN